MTSTVNQTVKLRKGDKVEINSNAPIQKIRLERGKYFAEFWIARRGKVERIFKTEKEARQFAGLKT